MKLNVKKFIFGIACLFTFLAVCIWRTPLSIQTNLNSLIEINHADWPIAKLTNKFSDVVNIVIESENLHTAKQTANEITRILGANEFDNLSMITTDFSVSDAIDQLRVHRNSFLSLKYRELLKNGEFGRITNNAVGIVSGSMAPSVLSLTDDPFLLATNYVNELKSANGKWTARDGFLWQYVAPNHYILISADVKARNTNDLVKTINSLTNAVKKLNSDDTRVFLSGIPIHTANMTQLSKLQLGIFSFIALAMAVLLNWLLFRRIATLLPVVLSLGLGFVAGAIIFDHGRVLFAFGFFRGIFVATNFCIHDCGACRDLFGMANIYAEKNRCKRYVHKNAACRFKKISFVCNRCNNFGDSRDNTFYKNAK